MNYILIIKSRSLILLIIMFFVALFITDLSCVSNKSHDLSKHHDIYNQNSASCSPPRIPTFYYPLTTVKFNSIINGNQHISNITIFYKQSLMDGFTFYIEGMGQSYDEPLPSFTGYSSGMAEDLKSANPPEYNNYSGSFEPSEVQAIFDYLNNHSSYFFNNEEFDGLSIPVEYTTYPNPLCDGDYIFHMDIYKPGLENFNVCWTIYKCVEVYPSPDHPLYGLFQMLENDFISQLENVPPDPNDF